MLAGAQIHEKDNEGDPTGAQESQPPQEQAGGEQQGGRPREGGEGVDLVAISQLTLGGAGGTGTGEESGRFLIHPSLSLSRTHAHTKKISAFCHVDHSSPYSCDIFFYLSAAVETNAHCC